MATGSTNLSPSLSASPSPSTSSNRPDRSSLQHQLQGSHQRSHVEPQSLTSFGFLDDSKSQESDNGLGFGNLFSRVKSAFAVANPSSSNSGGSPSLPRNPITSTFDSTPASTSNPNAITPSISNPTSIANSAYRAPSHSHSNSNSSPLNPNSNRANQSFNSSSPNSPIASRPQNRAGESSSESRHLIAAGSGSGNVEMSDSVAMVTGMNNTSSAAASASSSASPNRSRKDHSNQSPSDLNSHSSTLSRPNLLPQAREREREKEQDKAKVTMVEREKNRSKISSSTSLPKPPLIALRSLIPTPSLTTTTSTHVVAQRNPINDFDANPNLEFNPMLNSCENYSSIPGFPLSKDLLLDDSRSIHSVSSSLNQLHPPNGNGNGNFTAPFGFGMASGSAANPPRSTSDSMSISFNLANQPNQNQANQIQHSAARQGLQTSADAIYRNLRGQGMSKKFWMADESVRECRECLNLFGAFRRKHHCRVCGQIFCSRCASNILPGERFGHDGAVRVCNFCCKMLSDYEREERSSGYPNRNHRRGIINGNASGTMLKSSASASGNPNQRNSEDHHHQQQQHQNTTLKANGNGKVFPGMISEPLEAQMKSPLSEFAANHLFPRTGPSINFGNFPGGTAVGGGGSGGEGVGSYPSFATGLAAMASREDLDMASSRPETPEGEGGLDEEEIDRLGNENRFRNQRSNEDASGQGNGMQSHLQKEKENDDPAPFRKYLDQEDSATTNPVDATDSTQFENQDEISDPNQPDPTGVGNSSRNNSNQDVSSPPQSTIDSASASASGSGSVAFPSKGGGGGGSGSESPLHETHRGARFNVEDHRSRLVSDAALRALRHSRLKSRSGGLADLAKSTAANANGHGNGNVNGDDSFSVSHSRRDSFLGIPGGILGNSFYGNPGFNGAFGSELSPASLSHLTKMLSQTLDRAEVPKRELWTSILVPLVVRAVQQVRPNPRRGEAIDIRHYIKIKRNPGGSPSDCKFIDGFVLSKHVATKKMARNLPLHNARILVLTFSLDYFRDVEQQYVSLESLLAQEHEYTRILVARITALRPHIVVTEKTVSRLALDMLEEAGVTVVLNVKPSAIETISRCTQADIVSSIDRLSLEPRLGRCITFDVETFEHVTQIDKRKSFMRFSGPAKDLGCTILVRGGGTDLLHRIKAIVALAVFVGYNLRLEEHLMRDEGASLVFENPQPQLQEDSLPDLSLQSIVSDSEKLKVPDLSPRLVDASPKSEGNLGFIQFKEKVAESLEPYSTMLLSASASVRLPPPFPLAKIKEEGERLLRLKERDEAEETARIIRDEGKQIEAGPTAQNMLNDPEKPLAQHSSERFEDEKSASKGDQEKEIEAEKASLSSLPRLEVDMSRSNSSDTTQTLMATATPTLNQQLSNPHQPALVSLSPLGGKEQDLSSVLREPAEVARESEYRLAQARYNEHLREWQAYLNQKEGEVSITPFAHQRLVMLTTKVCTATDKPCFGPALRQVEFYGSSDETLGQYLERTCDDATSICTAKNCNRQNIFHYQTYVHYETRIQAVLERFVCPVPGEENRLLMWSYCKACQGATPISMVSKETWSLSYSKYLELHFYPGNVKPSQCNHDFFRDHVRYFAYKNLAIRFHSDSIHPMEIVVPTLKLFKRPEIQAQLKNQEALALARKNTAYWDSVAARIKALGLEVSLVRDATSKEHAYTSVGEMIKISEADRREMEAIILKTYVQSSPTDVLALNSARRALQDKVVQWDVDFNEFEKRLPIEKDVRRITTSHLKRLFAEREPVERVAEALGLPPSTELDEAVAEARMEEPKQSAAEALSAAAPDVVAGASAALETKIHSDLSSTPDQMDSEVSNAVMSNPAFPSSALLEERETEESDTTSSSPSALRHFKPQTPSRTTFTSRNPADDQSSCTENESFNVSQVHSLVRKFDTPNRNRTGGLESESDSAALSKVGAIGSARRPGMRRGKTEEKVSTRDNLLAGSGTKPSKVASLKTNRHGTDSVLSDDETAIKRVRGGSRSGSPTRAGQQRGDSKSRIPTRTPSSASLRSASSKTREAGNVATRRAAGPPSSYRPPKNLDPVGPSSRIPPGGRSISSTASSTPSKDRSISRSSSREAPARKLGGGLSRQTSSVNLKNSQQQQHTPSRLPAPTRIGSGTKSRVSTIARHFDRINREAEREREGHRQMMANRARRARPVAVTNARVEVFSSVKEAVKDESESSEEEDETGNASHADAEDEGESDGDTESKHTAKSPDSRQHSRMPSLQQSGGRSDQNTEGQDGPARKEGVDSQNPPCQPEASSEIESDVNSILGPSLSQISATLPSYLRGNFSSDTESGATERKSILNTLSGLFRGVDSLPVLEYPLNNTTEHVFADSKVIVREDEPSSIIAFFLSSKAYTDLLRSTQASRVKPNERDQDIDVQSIGDGWGMIDMPDERADLESALRSREETHPRFYHETGSARFNCQVLFAEQFDALRKSCACQESLIESLARCVKWDSSGGKSGSAFLKTRDDRLVVKQLSSSEMKAFSSFAPHYFEYMSHCIYNDRPTTLAKIFGCFRIAYKHSQTNKEVQLDCLVTENLFHGREMTKIYDLKGSTRNRHMKETGKMNEVLLDENLVEQAYKDPLFVREHSKRLLRAALWNDSLFLSDMNVMDYSLVVGLDQNGKELVVGIIDFVRTYTWDKRVESFVKETALLGGGGKGEPTIITPKQYRGRFLAFLDRIFLMSPDTWLSEAWA